MSKPIIYLDYNATAPVRPSVREAMLAAMELPLNPSSVHRYGNEAKHRLEQARKVIAESVSAFPNEVIFTATGTEANTMVLRGFPDRALLVSDTEHASVARTASLLGAAVIKSEDGIVVTETLDAMLANLGRPALVSIILAGNETGIIQPMRELAAVAHRHGALIHCDAVQAYGKIPLDMGLLGVDMMTISAHKVGGPVGIAALILRNDIAIKSLLVGGRQELGRRAGTESIALASGFAALAKDVASCAESPRIRALRDRLETSIGAEHVVGQGAERLPNTSLLLMPGVTSEMQLMQFDLAGFCVSAGSACSSGRIEPSQVLLNMGYAREMAGSAIRVSFGWATTEAEIDAFAEAWLKLHGKLGVKGTETQQKRAG